MPNASSALAPVRLRSIDALRGLCALVVFLSHWHLWSAFSPKNSAERLVHGALDALHDLVKIFTWPTGGHHPAVIAFFVLSGFCIHYPSARRAASGAAPPVWRDYFKRRFLRIMPVYWSACALGFLFVAAEALHPTGDPLLQLHAIASVGDMLLRFSALSAIYPREIFAGNYILVTVAVEIIVYAFYPLVFRCAARGQWRLLGLVALALHLVAIVLLPFVTPYWVFNSVFMLGLFWYAGALAAHLFVTRGAHVRAFWLVVIWATFLALKTTPHFYGQSLLKQALWGLICTLGILWLLKHEGIHPAMPDRAPMRFLRRVGEVSYTLYAVHTPIIMLTSWALLTLGHANYFSQLALTMTFSVATTFLIYRAIERVFYPAPALVSPAVTPAASHSLRS